MANGDGSPLDVSIEPASLADEEAVHALFLRFGVQTAIKRDYGRKTLDDGLPWIVLVQVPLTTFLSAFAEDMGEAAAKKTRELVRALVSQLFAERTAATGREGQLVLGGGDRTIVLQHDLPDTAWETLGEIDELPRGHVLFVRERGRWMSSGELR